MIVCARTGRADGRTRSGTAETAGRRDEARRAAATVGRRGRDRPPARRDRPDHEIRPGRTPSLAPFAETAGRRDGDLRTAPTARGGETETARAAEAAGGEPETGAPRAETAAAARSVPGGTAYWRRSPRPPGGETEISAPRDGGRRNGDPRTAPTARRGETETAAPRRPRESSLRPALRAAKPPGRETRSGRTPLLAQFAETARPRGGDQRPAPNAVRRDGDQRTARRRAAERRRA
jgi:hypothetical protein